MKAVDKRSELLQSPGLRLENDEVVFHEPWQANAFAMTLLLYEAGVFSWQEWASSLGAQIKSAQSDGDADDGTTYYHHWLSALEGLICEKAIAQPEILENLQQAWNKAAKNTPHGQPIVLRV